MALPSPSLGGVWRRGRDSNPRYRLRYTGLANQRTRPLCDLSYYYASGALPVSELHKWQSHIVKFLVLACLAIAQAKIDLTASGLLLSLTA